MSESDDDRARILLRRAAFVSGALAALGCAPHKPAESGPGTSPVAIPETSEGQEPTEPPPNKAPVAETPEGAPPSFELPDGIGEEATENFKRLFSNMQRIHPIVEEMAKLVPDGCSVLDSKCEDAWRRLAAKHNELREIQTFMYSCPGTSADAKLYAEREKEHLEYVAARMGAITRRIDKSLEADGARGPERWEELQQEAYNAAPYPCLSIACRDW
jgi:hypothetical protein